MPQSQALGVLCYLCSLLFKSFRTNRAATGNQFEKERGRGKRACLGL
jgi:hypothetical protein